MRSLLRTPPKKQRSRENDEEQRSMNTHGAQIGLQLNNTLRSLERQPTDSALKEEKNGQNEQKGSISTGNSALPPSKERNHERSSRYTTRSTSVLCSVALQRVVIYTVIAHSRNHKDRDKEKAFASVSSSLNFGSL
jgi:hypothetical protein